VSGATILIIVVVAILGVISGWLVPIIFKSSRPYGLLGDVLVCTITAVVLAYIEWVWILPALGFEAGWIKIAAAVGDPLVLGWISLWILRKIKS
jgi:hypothetical protein